MKWPNKDPNESLDYSLDWSRFLRESESLTSASWFISDTTGTAVSFAPGTTVNSLTSVSVGRSSTVTTITISGGENNTQYKLVCRVTLNTGFIAERSVTLYIKDR